MRVCCDGAPDGGGEGDAREDRLAILEMDSTRLADDRAPLARAAGSPVRLFSIDGCHTAEATAADLRVASSVMHPEGVVVVDDAFNPDWPGASSPACSRWRRDALETIARRADGERRTDVTTDDWNDVGLEPFLIGFGKVFLCRPAARGACRPSASPSRNENRLGARKTADFMGRECAVFRHGWISTFHGNE